MDDDGHQPIAIGHLSHSGDLKIHVPGIPHSHVISVYRIVLIKSMDKTLKNPNLSKAMVISDIFLVKISQEHIKCLDN